MEFKVTDNELQFTLSGKIDSTNAPAVENEILKVIEENPKEKIVLDIEDLSYVSSAGLRIFLKIKKLNANMSIINASLEVYDIFEMTGFTEILDVKKAYRKLSVEGLQVIGEGAKGVVYRYNGDSIVKVYKDNNALDDINRERTLARRAFVLGLPTCISYDIVKVDGMYGSVFELFDCVSFSEAIAKEPENLEKFANMFATLLKNIHSNVIDDTIIPSVDAMTFKWINGVLEALDEESRKKVQALIDTIEKKKNLLHMDYHTNNVLYQDGEAVLIDMDTLSYGNPIYELGSFYAGYVGFLSLDPEGSKKFLHLDLDTIRKFYDIAINKYFEGRDDLELIKKKIEFVGLLRTHRHTFKIKDKLENYDENIKKVFARIVELANELTDLNL